jgi:hypothetical protein
MPVSSLAKASGTDTRPWCNEEGAGRCDGMAVAVNGDVGTMVETVQRQILRYYTDVGKQASESFESAKRISKWGFGLVAATIGYVVLVDIAGHVHSTWFNAEYAGMNVGTIGLVGGGIVEFIAGVQFVLYGKATKQFGAFHICLERTHRYLLAYKIAEKIEMNRDETLEKIVCIMANAPMISRADIDGLDSGKAVLPGQPKLGSDPTITAVTVTPP